MASIYKLPRAQEFRDLIEDCLPGKTFRHVLSVTEFAVSFAEDHSIPLQPLVWAGLLHDYCKAIKGKKLLALAQEYNLEITPTQREKPILLHGPVAAEKARRTLNVTDSEVYDAIYWHTTGHPRLGPVGLALYIADFAEPLRARPEAAIARNILAEHGFLPALRYVAETKLAYVKTKDNVDPMTQDFVDWLRDMDPPE